MPTSPYACLILALAAAPRAQSSVFLPPNHQKVEGLSSHTYPWGKASSNTSRYGCRVQLCYDSVHFTSQGWKGRRSITRLRWRADGGHVTTGGTYPSVTVELSTSALDYSRLSRTFATNTGRDRMVVHQGSVTLAATGSARPNGFHVDLKLGKPFPYDPAAGDLLIDVAIGAAWTGGSAARADAEARVFGRKVLARMVMARFSDKSTRGDLLRVAQVMEIHFAGGGRAVVQPYGASCAGNTAAPPRLTAVSRPILGASFDVAVQGLSAGTKLGFFLLGGSRPGSGIDLGTIGAPGCKAWIGLPPALAHSFVPTRSTEIRAYPLPANPSFSGAEFYLQAATFVPGANAFGLLTTNGLAATTGTN